MEYLILAPIFALVSGLTFAGYVYWTRRRQADARLAAEGDGTGTDELPPRGMVLGDLTPALAAGVPMQDEARSELQRELRAAGYYAPTALMDYNALRVGLVVLPLVLAGIAALLFDAQVSGYLLLGLGVVGSMLGYSLPRLYIGAQARSRSHQIERALPAAIDMLTLCLAAGQNVLNSLQRVAHELRTAFPVLSSELEIVQRQAELRTLEFALMQFADRVNLSHLRNLGIILSQSEHLGTDAVSVLSEYADNMRINLKQHAESMANRAPFKLLFPAYLMAAGAAILLISPAVLELADFRKNNILQTSRDQVQTNQLQPPSQPPSAVPVPQEAPPITP